MSRYSYRSYKHLILLVLVFLFLDQAGVANSEEAMGKSNEEKPSHYESTTKPSRTAKTAMKKAVEEQRMRSESGETSLPYSSNIDATTRLIGPLPRLIASNATSDNQKRRTAGKEEQTRAPQQDSDRTKIEPYLSAYGGESLSNSLTDVHGIQSVSFASLSNLDLARSPIYGVKLGVFQPKPQSWFGLETELFYANPHIEQQPVTVTGPGGSVLGTLAGARVRMLTWAFNAIVRYPGERIQPYAGVGLGIFWARISGTDYGGAASDTSPGLNALGGVRIYLTKHAAMFGEYKYNRASLDFGSNIQLHTLYQAHYLVGGFSWSFR